MKFHQIIRTKMVNFKIEKLNSSLNWTIREQIYNLTFWGI